MKEDSSVRDPTVFRFPYCLSVSVARTTDMLVFQSRAERLLITSNQIHKFSQEDFFSGTLTPGGVSTGVNAFL